ncbi:MAG: OB-fold domain-containing protein [Chloroflexi bacterium]|nr:OB-fold domain-containing protein [Chloroflexota bacterium]
MAKEPEYIIVNIDTPRKYNWSTGKYLGHVYAEAKENKKLVGNKCPKCKAIMWGPTIVCPKCKVETGWEWEELPETGTVTQYTYLVFPLWDPHYGERWANPHPSGTILLENGVYQRHFLEETDPEKLKVGMRVQAVWKEDYDERGLGMQDVPYYRTIEE